MNTHARANCRENKPAQISSMCRAWSLHRGKSSAFPPCASCLCIPSPGRAVSLIVCCLEQHVAGSGCRRPGYRRRCISGKWMPFEPYAQHCMLLSHAAQLACFRSAIPSCASPPPSSASHFPLTRRVRKWLPPCVFRSKPDCCFDSFMACNTVAPP